MKKQKHKRWIWILIAAAAAAVLIVVMKNRVNITTYRDSRQEGTTVYTVGIIQSKSGSYADQMVQGSMDAMTDIFGTSHVKFTEKRVKTQKAAQKAAAEMAKNKELIVTSGTKALKGAEKATSTVPILSVGVINFQRALGMTVSSNWDYRTGRNVTGVVGEPSLPDTLSMLIEVTPDLKTVGMIRDPGDPDSVYQCDKMKTMLDQAGISSKVYDLAKTSSDSDAESLAETAVSECSALYFPMNCGLSTQASVIAPIAASSGVTTVAGDASVGRHTLATLYTDPYSQGYRAGKMAYSLLVKNENPKRMHVKIFDSSASQKLYQKTLAAQMNKSFPKSFSEIDNYLSHYDPTEVTTRINSGDTQQGNY
ncbi:MAG: ABC transporter substrate-binding protein [Pseudoramibacter sp.]